MPFTLTDEQRRFAAQAREVGAAELRPLAEKGDPGEVNRPLLAAMAEHGLLPRLFPAAVGGSRPGQVSAMDLCLLREALAQVCTDAETALALQGLGSYAIVQSGSAELARRWIPAVAAGDAVAGFALTEPEAGSDAGALQLRAGRDRHPPGLRRRTAGARTSRTPRRPTSTRSSPGPPPGPAPAASPRSSSTARRPGSVASRWSCSSRTPSAG